MMGSQFEKGVRDTETALRETASAVAGKAGEAIDKAYDRTNSALTKAAAQGSEAVDRAGDAAVDLRQAVEKSIRENPGASVAIAMAAGFVLASMWRTRA